jgi:hypothetical protein
MVPKIKPQSNPSKAPWPIAALGTSETSLQRMMFRKYNGETLPLIVFVKAPSTPPPTMDAMNVTKGVARRMEFGSISCDELWS